MRVRTVREKTIRKKIIREICFLDNSGNFCEIFRKIREIFSNKKFP